VADSILEQITADIVSSLDEVNSGESYGSGTYANTFTVQRRKRRGNAPEAGQTLAVVMMGQPIKLVDAAQDSMGWDQPYFIDIYVDPDESSTTDVDKAINSALADAEIALMKSEDARTRGGLAFDTRELAPVRFVDGPNQGVQVRVIVRYWTAFNDPRTAAGS
jgi:hypothetical protein